MLELESPTYLLKHPTAPFLTYNPPLGIKSAILIHTRRAGNIDYTLYSYEKSIY